MFHNLIANRDLRDVVLETNVGKHGLKNVAKTLDSKLLAPAEAEALKLLAYASLVKNTTALVLHASEYAFFTHQRVATICIEPLPIPSRKTILQTFLERVKHLFGEAHKRLGVPWSDKRITTPVYIMTSEKSNEQIYAYLEHLQFLGFSNLFVFPQKDLPAFDARGKIVLKQPQAVHLFANGSGGLFHCIKSFDLINHL